MIYNKIKMLKLQSPSILYVKDRLCKRVWSVLENVSVCKCNIHGK